MHLMDICVLLLLTVMNYAVNFGVQYLLESLVSIFEDKPNSKSGIMKPYDNYMFNILRNNHVQY